MVNGIPLLPGITPVSPERRRIISTPQIITPTRAPSAIPLVTPGVITPRRIPERERPVPSIPSEPICAKVCDILNDEINALEVAIGVRTQELGTIIARTPRRMARRQVIALRNRLESLDDLRFRMKEEGSCSCIE